MSAADPTPAERCPSCGHVPHTRLPFCPNMASDNDCSCSLGAAPPAVPDTGDVARLTHDEREALRPVLERYARWESAHDGPVFEVVEGIVAAHDARVRHDTAEQIAQAIESSCDHPPRVGGWCLTCDQHARIAREAGTTAEPAADPGLRELVGRWRSLADAARVPAYAAGLRHAADQLRNHITRSTT